MEWIETSGGVKEMEKRAIDRSDKVYAELERNKFFVPTVGDPVDRSRMNITFQLKPEYAALETAFLDLAKARGLVGIKGHRSVGGFRASCYNALPMESVDALVAALQEFEKSN